MLEPAFSLFFYPAFFLFKGRLYDYSEIGFFWENRDQNLTEWEMQSDLSTSLSDTQNLCIL